MTKPNDGDLVVISMHEKGFPTADLYIDCLPEEEVEEGTVPDGFFTLKRGDSIEQACAHARSRWPGATVMIAEEPSDDDDN